MTTRLGLFRLRNAELIRYFTQLLALIDASGSARPAPLEEAVAALRAQLNALNELYKTDPGSEHSEALALAEEERDNLVRGLYRYCEAFTYLTDPALHSAGKLLRSTIEVYGTG
ncbi:MAG: hypothetical protein EOO11_20150, partial [Chitinophagaceae bacterium]